jgi:hypothetical protein
MAALTNTLVPDWTPDRKVQEWADEHDFSPAMEMTDKNLRALSKKHGGKPSGLYLWEGEGHEVYVGISNGSVVTRLRQHVKNYEQANIQSFRFLKDKGDRSALRSIEREMIYDLCRKNFTCFNREHSSVIFGDSVLDELVPVQEQEAWFADPVGLNGRDLARVLESEPVFGSKAAGGALTGALRQVERPP